MTWTEATSDGVTPELRWSSGSSSSSTSKGNQSDSGSYTFAATDTATATSAGNTITGNIQAYIKLTRKKSGTHPSALKGSSTAEQYKEVGFTLKD